MDLRERRKKRTNSKMIKILLLAGIVCVGSFTFYHATMDRQSGYMFVKDGQTTQSILDNSHETIDNLIWIFQADSTKISEGDIYIFKDRYVRNNAETKRIERIVALNETLKSTDHLNIGEVADNSGAIILYKGKEETVSVQQIPQCMSSSWIKNLIWTYGTMYNVDPYLIYAQIRQESNFNPNAVSSAGCCGLMQLSLSTASEFSRNYIDQDSIFDPETNIQAGVRYDAWLMGRYHGDLVKVLASYNAGFNNTDSWVDKSKMLSVKDIPYQETKTYVWNVLSYYWYYQSKGWDN